MALASDLIKAGFSARQAKLLGDTFATVGATGSTVADAFEITDSIIYVSSATNTFAGVELPLIAKSNTKHCLIGNDSGVSINVYSKNESQNILSFDGGGIDTLATIPDNSWAYFTAITNIMWGAFLK